MRVAQVQPFTILKNMYLAVSYADFGSNEISTSQMSESTNTDPQF